MKLARDAATILVLATLFISVRVRPPEPLDLLPATEAGVEAFALPAVATPEPAVQILPALERRVLRLDLDAAPAAAPESCPLLQVKRVKHGATHTVTIEVNPKARPDAEAGCDREAICLPVLTRNDC